MTEVDALGDDHVATSIDTPMRKDAFDMTDEEKIAKISGLFREVMLTLGLDLEDDSLKGTPQRVAKMYVKEVFSGLNPQNLPKATVFENKYCYNEMLIERNITYFSFCEHHFLPIFGQANVAYISSGKVIGLSKINRIVDYYARRPQVQERMTVQIRKGMQEAVGTDDVAVIVEGRHLCVCARGIQDTTSSTVTSDFAGKFQEENVRRELLQYLKMDLMG